MQLLQQRTRVHSKRLGKRRGVPAFGSVLAYAVYSGIIHSFISVFTYTLNHLKKQNKTKKLHTFEDGVFFFLL